MPHVVDAIRCLTDNYAYLLHDPEQGVTAVIDAPEAAPIMAALRGRGWTLDMVLLTHHHGDHVDGADALRAATGARVIGAAADAHRLPPLDQAVRPGDRIDIGAQSADILDVSGHTIGHIAFHLPGARLAFTADSLMALGCGRLFEGSPAQMWDSLSRLMALPDDTQICSGHDYIQGNAAFALSVDADNPALHTRLAALSERAAQGGAMAISTLAEEKATNPFLRATSPQMKAALDMADQPDAAVFAHLRALKDRF